MKSGAVIVPALAVSMLAVLMTASRQAAVAADKHPAAQANSKWDRTGAADYLDSREVWWQGWSQSQRDHDTVCVSCHTVVPYALARPLLHREIGETALAGPERIMYDGIVKRVTLWSQVEPFYNDGKSGPNKSVESRSTEAVLNALILGSYDRRNGHLSDVTKSAFRNAWALQRQSGYNQGAWIWLNFHNGPWESNESEYWGATLAAVAAGTAPDHYLSTPGIQGNLKALRAYLRREYATQPLVNRIALLWASAKFPGLLTGGERAALLQSIYAEQQADGGWRLTDLGAWERHDHTELIAKSDGYATGLTVLALEETGMGMLAETQRGRAWLIGNQSKDEGSWPAWSLNKEHDPASDTGHFMSDAATGYAVLALEQNPK